MNNDFIIKHCDANDFDAIYDLCKKNIKLLGYVMPPVIREKIAKQHNLGLYEKSTNKLVGFTLFNPLKREQKVTISEFCVNSDYRGQGLGRLLFDAVCDLYSTRIMRCKCVKDSTAEAFWLKVSTKIGEEQGKKRPLAVFEKRGSNYIELFDNVSNN